MLNGVLNLKNMKFKYLILTILSFTVFNSSLYAQDSIPTQPPISSTGTMVQVPIAEYDDMRAQINELSNARGAWEYKLDSLKKSDELVIIGLKKDIEEKDNKINQYELNYVMLVSNFIYLPYDKASVEYIVKPAYDLLQKEGKATADKYQNRLSLAINYYEDLKEIINFFNTHKKEIAMLNPITIQKNAKSYLDEFNNLPAVKGYMSFEDYNNTYLGRIIVKINNLLKNPSGAEKERIKSTIENIDNELQTLLKQANQ